MALEHLPDVMFLDIKMPGKTGLDVAEMVADDWPTDKAAPLFVFVTAYDEFAVPAFERAAVDYLLKPATLERLQVTVERLQQRLAERAQVPDAGELAMEGAFKTPGLRGVTQRPPFMHAGQFATVEETIAHYVRSPASVVGLSELAHHSSTGHADRKPIRLSDAEATALASFLGALSDLVQTLAGH